MAGGMAVVAFCVLTRLTPDDKDYHMIEIENQISQSRAIYHLKRVSPTLLYPNSGKIRSYSLLKAAAARLLLYL